MSSPLAIALYARVSSDQQARQQTIASQLAALHERIGADGGVCPDAYAFIDDGYSGTTLLRPALERLRDQAAFGAIDRLYIHSPDRLARRYAYQVLLLDEFKRAGVEVVFLNHDISKSPEDEMLLQMQGVIAEYERTKIMERCRRGKLHAARRGCVEVLHCAPYGYRYRPRSADAAAAFVVQEEEAEVVRMVFSWVAAERIALGEAARRLTARQVPTPNGNAIWSRSTLASMLSNSAYIGAAAYGRTRVGERRSRLRPSRGQPEVPRRSYSTYRTRPEDQILIAVPALVAPELFEGVQQTLRENRKRHRQGQRGVKYLLQGLVVCAHCQRALYGRPVTSVYKGRRNWYTYYRCTGKEPYRFGGGAPRCDNRQVRTERLEQTVWEDVCSLLRDPARLHAEYERRLVGQATTTPEQLKQTRRRLQKAQQAVENLINALAGGLIGQGEFERHIKPARQRVKALEAEQAERSTAIATAEEVKEVVARWHDFADQIEGSLQDADWATKRRILTTLVKRVEVGNEEVHIIYRVPGDPAQRSAEGFVSHCPGNTQSQSVTKYVW
jgi:site-specific DNA recombinase